MISLEDIEDKLGITPESQPEIADPELRMLLDEYKDVFRDKLPDQLPTKRDVEHIIELKEDAQPRRSHQYHLPPAHQEAIQETVAELIKLKHIEPSRSAWRAPLLVVIKKDGTPRVVVDFRFLNSNTVGQDYFMKNPQEMLDAAAGHKFLSSMDFTSGFHQVPMAPKSKELTSFSVPGPKGGQYQFRVMPFGLKGAPATFQQFMDDVFRPILGQSAVIYIDDIAIFSDSKKQHMDHLRQVFQLMRDNQIYAKRKKCFFMQEKIPYLGHIISKDGIEMDPKKVETITNWPEIKSIKQLRAFLGLMGYYRRFLAGFAEMAKPLTNLLKAESTEDWSQEHTEAQQKLISLLTSAPLLQGPKYNQPFEVTTDTSNIALGAVLAQEGKPVAFLSKTFTDAEVNWTIYEKELFAIVYALRKWEYYLLSIIPFTLITDNRAVTYIQKQERITPKQARWLTYMAQFQYKIIHKDGAENKVADGISRKDIFGITIIENQHWIDRLRQLSDKIQLQD